MPLTNPEWFEPLERWMFRRAIRQMVDGASVIITVSEYVHDQVREQLDVDAARVVAVHLGVSDAFRVSAQGSDEEVLRRYGVRRGRYVITVGNVEERKNLAMLVGAFAAARAALPDLTLVVAGPERAGAAAVRAEAERLRLSDAVRFTGYVAGDELPTLVSGAAALLHPSTDEGFGLTPLEAMAAGVPTAVSFAGSLPEIVGDAAPMLDPSDAAAWTSAIVRLVDDAAWRAQLIDAGRARARWFSWDRTAAATAAVYERCIG
jgi:glycosyltransferase involved in cell wall biosynthesis